MLDLRAEQLAALEECWGLELGGLGATRTPKVSTIQLKT